MGQFSSCLVKSFQNNEIACDMRLKRSSNERRMKNTKKKKRELGPHVQYMKVLSPASERLIFQLQYFSNKYLLSRTCASNDIELTTVCFSKFTQETYKSRDYTGHKFEGAGLKLIAGIRK